MRIAQLSDVHVGAARYDVGLLRAAIAEINELAPDLVVVAGDLTDDGYRDQYEPAQAELASVRCPRVVFVPGNHDARNVGYRRFEKWFGPRDSQHRFEAGGIDVSLVGVDSSKPDLDDGEVGREQYGWVEEALSAPADLRIFVCHHHLVAIPDTGREANQLHDAGDVLALLRRTRVDLVLGGHRHVPYVWPIAGMLLVNSGTVSTTRTRGFERPAYNLIEVDAAAIVVELRVPGGDGESLGTFARTGHAPA
jgi:3',5'-cyclic AMP phosphodiesterase CpdA